MKNWTLVATKRALGTIVITVAAILVLGGIPSLAGVRGGPMASLGDTPACHAREAGATTCYRCSGTGTCWNCNGTCKIGPQDCYMCSGTGKCYFCNGSGECH